MKKSEAKTMALFVRWTINMLFSRAVEMDIAGNHRMAEKYRKAATNAFYILEVYKHENGIG